ncbi:glutathione transferase GST 23-like [Argentina anserina]|uniref:glutathione transferase GST 23-like n=1 Tax=Argentina anserina TaxID=57926 RepID=UPI0021763A02|nr:glutathione transferase GST 23-like [Potentilla anserina]
MSEEKVQLLGHWASPFALRVEWTLKLKEIEYEYVQEDLPNKSHLLLKYNPVYKKIPVLVHGGKPIAESLVILEYLDENWKHNPILPEDPYERAQARFWARFVEEKFIPAMMSAFSKKGEEKEKAAKEARENLKILESGLGEKQFFGGESIGFVDIAAGWIGVWARMVEEIAEVTLIDIETMPLLDAWFRRVLDVPIIKECLPPQDKVLERFKGFHQFLTGGSS